MCPKERHRAVVQPRADGGRACPQLLEERPCNTRPCGSELWYDVRSVASWPYPALDVSSAADGHLSHTTATSAVNNTAKPITLAFELGGVARVISGARVYKSYTSTAPTYEPVNESPLCANSSGSLAAWTTIEGTAEQAADECNAITSCIGYQQLSQQEYILLCSTVAGKCNNTAKGQVLEPYDTSWMASTVCLVRKNALCGKADVDVLYSAAEGDLPLADRSYLPVSGLKAGLKHEQEWQADNVTGHTMYSEAHDSSKFGWGYISFDTVLATALSFKVKAPDWCIAEVQLMGLSAGCDRTGGFKPSRYAPGSVDGYGAPQQHTSISSHGWQPSQPAAQLTQTSWKCISLTEAALECSTSAACVAFVYSDRGVKFKTSSLSHSVASTDTSTVYMKSAPSNSTRAELDPTDVAEVQQYEYRPGQSVVAALQADLSASFGGTVAECTARCDATPACAAFVRHTATLGCQLVLTSGAVELNVTTGVSHGCQ